MKKNLRHLWLLLVGVLITFSSQQAHASHAIGGDLSYTNVGPGLFFVTFRFYRDCSGIPAPGDFTLQYSATGCGPNGTGGNAGGQVTLLPRSSSVGNPYCAQQNNQSPCDSANSTPSNGFPNYQIFTYAAIVNLGSGPNSVCNEWVMSTSLNARPNTANLNTASDLYTEARLNTRLAPADNSPTFEPAPGFGPLIFTCDTTYNGISSGVRDSDNNTLTPKTDSLVYRSAQPLSGLNTTIQYAPPYSLNNPVRVWPATAPPPRTQGGPNPLLNYPFTVNPIDGFIQFTSGLYVPGSNNDEANKFSLRIIVESWRKTTLGSNQRQKISTVQRDIMATIFRCPQRSQPPVATDGDSTITNGGVIGSQTFLSKTDTIVVDACNNATVDIDIQEPNGDSVYALIQDNFLPGQARIFINRSTVVPGILTIAKVRLLWVPDSSTIGGYYPVTILLQDNGCPLPARSELNIVLHVIKNQYSSVGLNTRGGYDTLRLGDSTQLTATTQRPATFGIDNTPAVYTYQWVDSVGTPLPLPQAPVVTVRPTRTTRYYVRVTSPQGCIDTASFRIFVVPFDIYNVITPNGDGKNDYFVASGIRSMHLTVFNRWGRKLEEIDNYDNRWNGGDLSAGVYYYLIRDKDENKQYKGWFQIVK